MTITFTPSALDTLHASEAVLFGRGNRLITLCFPESARIREGKTLIGVQVSATPGVLKKLKGEAPTRLSGAIRTLTEPLSGVDS